MTATLPDRPSTVPPEDEVVTIGVLTFRRPGDLAAVLPLLLDQAAGQTEPGRRVEVLVVDNDPDASAAPVVDALRADTRGADLRYVVEPTPGIAAARNRVLDEAAGSRLLVFVDDDERPHPGWLGALLDTAARTGAAAVAGAVVSDFVEQPGPWVQAGDFFRRRRLATGAAITVAATNNLLLDVAAVRAAGARFDPAFGLTGGSDSLFTRQLSAAGYLLVWCDEAVVTDSVPASRVTRRWVLRRAFRSGNSAGRVDVVLASGAGGRLRARTTAVARGLPRLAAGLARWALGHVLRSPAHQARGLRTAARGAGMVTGAVGVVYAEYRRRA